MKKENSKGRTLFFNEEMIEAAELAEQDKIFLKGLEAL